MTGLAQVCGLRGETDTELKLLQRVAADLEYIDRWSLWLDLKILTRTVVSLFTAHGAY
jgi:putative colanic acid biosynthesis UDP-glucose lipid carrier transferase